MERIADARQTERFFEINSSPDRLDLSAENARVCSGARVLDCDFQIYADSIHEFGDYP